ncbi:DarT ssDNA thymidine ADP-ribosyltransferase family protein [Persephonella sp.]
MQKRRNGKFEFYYITHIDNLKSILEYGILSNELISNSKLDFKKISNEDIIRKRREKGLANYANLYINPRNAMMYRIHKKLGWPVVVIGVNGNDILGKENVKLSIGNAASDYSEILDKKDFKNIVKFISDIRNIRDWISEYENIPLSEYLKTEEYGFLSSKKFLQSEVLVKEKVNKSYIKCVYVPEETMKEKVSNIVESMEVNTDVILNPDMFFEPIRKVEITDNISIVQGDMFTSNCELLTVSVNTVGVMGKGLASRFKYMYPEVYVFYENLCKRKILKLGVPYIFVSENFKRKFLLFPTKGHWKEKSKIDNIVKGLDWFIENYGKYDVESAAFPALGCGLGGLKWEEVGPIMVHKLKDMDIPIEIYLPEEKNIKEKYFTREFYRF